jgi:hypothetical protein
MEMQDGVKGNPEESLRRALAEFADETSSGVASDRVRLALRREVRAKARRRWILASLATAAALAAIVLGVTARRAPLVTSTAQQTAALERRAPVSSSAPARDAVAPGATAAVASPRDHSVTAAVRRPARPRPSATKKEATGEWRKGEMVLSPWYYNTALPPAARSVLVRSEVDARTAMRFGVVSAGDTAPVEILFGEDGLPRAMRFVRHLPAQTN